MLWVPELWLLHILWHFVELPEWHLRLRCLVPVRMQWQFKGTPISRLLRRMFWRLFLWRRRQTIVLVHRTLRKLFGLHKGEVSGGFLHASTLLENGSEFWRSANAGALHLARRRAGYCVGVVTLRTLLEGIPRARRLRCRP
jgi:hypothetical protein